MDFKIREATFDDVDRMLEITSEMHELLDLKRLAPFNRPFVESFLAEAIYDTDKLAVVSELDGRVFGLLVAVTFGHWFNPSVKFAQEMMIWVEQEHRSSGAGSALIGSFEKWASEQHLDVMCLSSSGRYMTDDLMSFYTSRGYSQESNIYLKGSTCHQ